MNEVQLHNINVCIEALPVPMAINIKASLHEHMIGNTAMGHEHPVALCSTFLTRSTLDKFATLTIQERLTLVSLRHLIQQAL